MRMTRRLRCLILGLSLGLAFSAAKVRAEPTPSTNRAPTDRGDQDGTGAPPTVSCKDGTQSKGGSRGACSHHGGVADAAPNGSAGPAVDAPPQQGAGKAAGVMCKDGTRSAESGRGGCSHHGGLAAVGGATVNESAPSATDEREPSNKSGGKGGKHADPAGATAQCSDGTYSHSQNRARTCSHHGGVAKWLGGASGQ